MLALDTSSPISTTKSIEEFLDVNSNVIIDTAPALAEMKETLERTSTQFNRVVKMMSMHQGELTRAMEHLSRSGPEHL
jgi:hypothetical protein